MDNEILISENDRQIYYSSEELVSVVVSTYEWKQLENNLNNEFQGEAHKKSSHVVFAKIQTSDLKIGQSIFDDDFKYKGYRVE